MPPDQREFIDRVEHLSIRRFIAPAGAGRRWRPDPDYWQAFKAAELIFGYDPRIDNAFVVFGRDALRAISRFNEPRDMRVLVIDLDQASDELEWLIALLRVHRGQDDYQAAESKPKGRRP